MKVLFSYFELSLDRGLASIEFSIHHAAMVLKLLNSSAPLIRREVGYETLRGNSHIVFQLEYIKYCHLCVMGTLLSYIIFPRLWLIPKRKGNNGRDISQDCSEGEMT